MKKIISVLAAIAIITAANAQSSFSLNAGLTFDNYGWLEKTGKANSTQYAGLTIAPDWQLAKHWGLRLDVGAGWSFASNASGTWERPMHSTTNIRLAVVPYYEFNINRWFIDLGAAADCRMRLPYLNQELSKYIMTLSVGVGADLRAGYRFKNNLGVFGQCGARRTVYDLLYKTLYHDGSSTTSGCITASAGITYRIK